jgi:hypothetical protein
MALLVEMHDARSLGAGFWPRYEAELRSFPIVDIRDFAVSRARKRETITFQGLRRKSGTHYDSSGYEIG